jgi:hypothetical protein
MLDTPCACQSPLEQSFILHINILHLLNQVFTFWHFPIQKFVVMFLLIKVKSIFVILWCLLELVFLPPNFLWILNVVFEHHITFILMHIYFSKALMFNRTLEPITFHQHIFQTFTLNIYIYWSMHTSTIFEQA